MGANGECDKRHINHVEWCLPHYEWWYVDKGVDM